jgi:Domain of unknown function (DUF4114)
MYNDCPHVVRLLLDTSALTYILYSDSEGVRLGESILPKIRQLQAHAVICSYSFPALYKFIAGNDDATLDDLEDEDRDLLDVCLSSLEANKINALEKGVGSTVQGTIPEIELKAALNGNFDGIFTFSPDRYPDSSGLLIVTPNSYESPQDLWHQLMVQRLERIFGKTIEPAVVAESAAAGEEQAAVVDAVLEVVTITLAIGQNLCRNNRNQLSLRRNFTILAVLLAFITVMSQDFPDEDGLGHDHSPSSGRPPTGSGSDGQTEREPTANQDPNTEHQELVAPAASRYALTLNLGNLAQLINSQVLTLSGLQRGGEGDSESNAGNQSGSNLATYHPIAAASSILMSPAINQFTPNVTSPVEQAVLAVMGEAIMPLIRSVSQDDFSRVNPAVGADGISFPNINSSGNGFVSHREDSSPIVNPQSPITESDQNGGTNDRIIVIVHPPDPVIVSPFPVDKNPDPNPMIPQDPEPLPWSAQFSGGVFTVGSTGQVSFDYLVDGGGYEGQVGIFSLDGLDKYEFGSSEFLQEVARRIVSESLGDVMINDIEDKAKITRNITCTINGESMQIDDQEFNQGVVRDPKIFTQFKPGQTFGIALIPNGSFADWLNNPGSDLQPFVSLTRANDQVQFANVNSNRQGIVIGIEDVDVNIDKSDHDYDDMLFRITGATGTLEPFDQVAKLTYDWRAQLPEISGFPVTSTQFCTCADPQTTQSRLVTSPNALPNLPTLPDGNSVSVVYPNNSPAQLTHNAGSTGSQPELQAAGSNSSVLTTAISAAQYLQPWETGIYRN